MAHNYNGHDHLLDRSLGSRSVREDSLPLTKRDFIDDSSDEARSAGEESAKAKTEKAGQ